MNRFNINQRVEIYKKAISTYGLRNQLVVALEELSEVQKEICKLLRGTGDISKLGEEIADATIMMEQLRFGFDMNELVCRTMDDKLERLVERIDRDND